MIDLSALAAPVGRAAYPLDFSGDDSPRVPTDAERIPMVDYASLGRQYNPWFIGHIALGRFSRWAATGEEASLQGFRHLADWFVRSAVVLPTGVAWLYRYPWLGGQAVPWYSGISQAHAISVLIRAATVFGEERYAETARRAMDLMISPLEEGGTAVEWPDGSISLEESRRTPASAILNGHLFAVYAAWEAGRFFSTNRYAKAAERGWAFVSHRIALYDLGVWSRYSLRIHRWGMPDIASPHYHAVHVAQLRIAAAVTGDRRLAVAAERFDAYQRDSRLRRRAWRRRLIIKLLN